MKKERPSVWRVVHASVAGSAHIFGGVPCQDRHAVRLLPDVSGTEILVIAVADGAGSAEQAATGAETAISWFLDSVEQTLADHTLASIEEAECHAWLRLARQAVLDAAAHDVLPPHALACTLTAVVVAPDVAWAIQIGDGVIALRAVADKVWRVAFWPQKGEHRNETRFLTDPDAEARALVLPLGAGIAQLAVSSDGLEDLCLDRAAQTAFSPFFDGLIATLQAAPDESYHELRPALERYLGSDSVNALTDDDKTLVLAILRQDI